MYYYNLHINLCEISRQGGVHATIVMCQKEKTANLSDPRWSQTQMKNSSDLFRTKKIFMYSNLAKSEKVFE
jgi:hypothetical protein